MNKKILIPSLCVIFVVCLATVVFQSRHDKTVVNINHPDSENEFIVDGGPMMPPPHHPMAMHLMGPGPMFGPRHDMDKIIKLSDSQRDRLKKLDVDFHHNMNVLHSETEEVREKYLEKMDAVLTAEQFRKIQKMRMDLRKEIKKLQNKQTEILEKHRNDFESILTPDQKNLLRREHDRNQNK